MSYEPLEDWPPRISRSDEPLGLEIPLPKGEGAAKRRVRG
jgi:hypothetical protein